MKNPYQKLLTLQWLVITALLIGAAAGAFMLLSKTSQLSGDRDQLTSDNTSLRYQLRQTQAQLAATPTPTPTPVPTATPTPIPSPTHTPTPTPRPKTR